MAIKHAKGPAPANKKERKQNNNHPKKSTPQSLDSIPTPILTTTTATISPTFITRKPVPAPLSLASTPNTISHPASPAQSPITSPHSQSLSGLTRVLSTTGPTSPISPQIPLSLPSTTLTNLVNSDHTLHFTNNIANPLNRGWNPKRVTPATSHHVSSRPSMLSMANIKQGDYTGFVNLAILTFVIITLRLIIENLLKYGLLFKWSILSIDLDENSTILDNISAYLDVLIPFFGLIIYITIITPLVAYLIEVFASRKSLFLPKYVEIKDAPQLPQNSLPITKGLITSKVARYLHIINATCAFIIPLVYIWNTTVLILVARFPIAFATVITTMKLFSYIHTSTELRGTTGQLVVIDTSLHHNEIDASKSLSPSQNRQNISFTNPLPNINRSSHPLCSINPDTALAIPHQGKQTIEQLQYDVYGNMCLFYLENVKILIHTIKYRFSHLSSGQDTTQGGKNNKNGGFMINPFRWLSNIITFPFILAHSIFFGSDKKNRVYTIVTRGFGLNDHAINTMESGGAHINSQLIGGNHTSTSSNPLSVVESHTFSFNFDYFNHKNQKMGGEHIDQPHGEMLDFYVENQFTQYNTTILAPSMPKMGINTNIATPAANKSLSSKHSTKTPDSHDYLYIQQPIPVRCTTLSPDVITANDNDDYVMDQDQDSLDPLSPQPTTRCTQVDLSVPIYPQVLPRFSVIEYAPCLYQLFYFLLAPTLIYQFSYPRANRIKLHFLFRRIFEIIFIGLALVFLIEQYVKPTLHNSIQYFLQLDEANLHLKQTLRSELHQQVLTHVPSVLNNTISFIDTSLNNTVKFLGSHLPTNSTTVLTNLTSTIANYTTPLLQQAAAAAAGSTTIQSHDEGFFTSMSHTIDMFFRSSINIFERTLKLSFPNVLIWLLIFYMVFHSYLNLVAELTQFADRVFYLEWWNSRDLGEYWNKWNKPVHQYFARHIFSVLLSNNISSTTAKVMVFFVSAVLHEVLIAIPCQMVAFHAFFGMMAQVPLILITTQIRHPFWGNALFWLTFCLLGQPSLILTYFYQYLTTHNLVPSAMTAPGALP